MGLFNKIFGKKTQDGIESLSGSVQLSQGPNFTPINKDLVMYPGLTYARSLISPADGKLLKLNGRVTATVHKELEYDLAEYKRIADVESFVNIGNIKKKRMTLKNGYKINSANPKTIDYINRRFYELDRATNQSMSYLIAETCGELGEISNSFWVKVRSAEYSTGKRSFIPGIGERDPIAGYFRIPAETMFISHDMRGTPVSYVQRLNGLIKYFAPEDVIHFTYRKKAGFAGGTPLLVPVKEDIKALRHIEESVQILLDQALFPMFKIIIGTPDRPATVNQYGVPEIEVAKAEWEGMVADGAIILPERWNVEVIGSENKALRAEGYLDYYLNRMIGGMGFSKLDFGYGDSANRNTADSLSKGAIDLVKDLQAEFEEQFTINVIRELLNEGPFTEAFLSDPNNETKFVFNDPDIESMIALQNHAALMQNLKAITPDEVRKDYFKKNPLPDSEKSKLYQHDEEAAKIAAKYAPKTTTSAGAKVKKKAKKKNGSKASQAVAASKNRPSNQYGTKLSPAKSIKDTLQQNYEELMYDIGHMSISNAGYVNTVLYRGAKYCKKHFKNDLYFAFDMGLKNKEYQDDPLIDSAKIYLANKSLKFIDRIFDDTSNYIIDNLSKHPNNKEKIVRDAYDLLNQRIKMIEATETRRAYIYGKAYRYKLDGVNTIKTLPGANSNDPEIIINLKELRFSDLDKLPPYHPNCNADIGINNDK